MKIRAITIGIPGIPTPETIRSAGRQLEQASQFFSAEGISVQSRRIALPHWRNGLGTIPEADRTSVLEMADALCAETGIDFCSVGMISEPDQVDHISHLLPKYSRLNASAEICSREHGRPNAMTIVAAAKAVRHLAENSVEGFGNFRFGAGASLGPGTPYFPGSYHEGTDAQFTIGCENSDVLIEAFAGAKDLEAGKQRLFELLSMAYKKLEGLALELSDALKVNFCGLDTSIAPSLAPDESIVRAFRNVNVEFGDVGTLAVCGAVTGVLKQIDVKRVGYCGIMLPILEDVGLAQAADSGSVNVAKLLSYSSVCGVGVDMVPIPGATSLQDIESLMFDVSVMSLKLGKPLSVRVLPVPGKAAGERTEFESVYVCDAKVLPLS